MEINKLSIKTAIIGTAGLVILIGIIYLAYSLNKNFEKTVVSQTQQELLTVADAISTGLNEFFNKHSEMLRVISKNPLFQKRVYEKKSCDEPIITFCSIKNLYAINKKDVDALTLLDANGIMLHREPYIKGRLTHDHDHTDKPGTAYVLREHKPHISEFFRNHNGKLAVSILEPIFYKDEFAGIARWMIKTDRISKRFIEPIKIGNKGFVWIFDNKNIVISHPKKELIGMSVLDIARKLHKKKNQVFDESQIQEHIKEKHDYINRVKVEKEGVGVFIGCDTNEMNIVVYKKVQRGNAAFNLILMLPYSEIIGPINKHETEIFGLAGFVIILLGSGGLVLFRSQKEKARLETEAGYLKQIANGAEALRKSEEKFRKFVENTDDLVTLVDSNGRFIYVNDTSEKIFDLSPEECIGLYAFDFIHPDDREKTRAAFAEWVRNRISSTTYENRQISRTGQVHHMQWAINQDFDEDGNLIAINSIARDFTDLKLAEDTLAAEKERLEVTLRSIGDGVIATDADGKIILLNRVAEKLTGWVHQEAVGKPLGAVFHIINETTRERSENPVEQVIKSGKIIEHANHTILINKDGTEIVLADSAAPILDTGKNIIGVVLVFRNITEKRKIEAHLQQSLKMEAIANLAGGIAHEFNNALAGTSGNIELLQMKLPDDENIDKYAERMKDSVHRMVGLTSQLLAYARGGKYQVKTMSLKDLVEDTLPVLQHNIAHSLRVETDLPDDISNVKVDPTQIRMVLSAVLTNASEAMEEKGRIRIIIRNEQIDEVSAKNNPNLKPGPYVCLTIEDEGKGIEKENIHKVFDPFFTTKFQGRGLGMAAAYGVIRNHGGSISLYSELGKGTAVRIYLPAKVRA